MRSSASSSRPSSRASEPLNTGSAPSRSYTRDELAGVGVVALEEEVVHAPVADRAQHHAPAPACRRARRGRSPGSSPRRWRGWPGGARCARPACRCPCRRRWWRRSRRAWPARNSLCTRSRAGRVQARVVGARREAPAQAARDLVGALARGRVDDRGQPIRAWPSSSSAERVAGAGQRIDRPARSGCRDGSRG